jgi:hypothetical protein
MRMTKISFLALFTAFSFAGCQKEDETPQVSLYYGDEVFYRNEEQAGKLVHPAAQLGQLKGLFTAEPAGLHLNNTTGAIDINKSDAGVQYTVTYVSSDNKTTAQTSVLVSGIYYLPEIYDLSDGNYTVTPVYNKDKKLAIPQGSAFDVPNPNTLASARDAGLGVDPITGKLDLKKLTDTGKMSYGDTKDFTIYYRLKDGSNSALNSIKIRVMRVKTDADIPAAVWEEVLSHRTGRKSGLHDHGPPVVAVKD